jgi:hypothetical protein
VNSYGLYLHWGWHLTLQTSLHHFLAGFCLFSTGIQTGSYPFWWASILAIISSRMASVHTWWIPIQEMRVLQRTSTFSLLAFISASFFSWLVSLLASSLNIIYSISTVSWHSFLLWSPIEPLWHQLSQFRGDYRQGLDLINWPLIHRLRTTSNYSATAISTIHKSPQHLLSPFPACCVFTIHSLAMCFQIFSILHVCLCMNLIFKTTFYERHRGGHVRLR